MTIMIINPVDGSESQFTFLTGVQGVTDTQVIFYSGFERSKRICAKVDVVSLMDAPEKSTHTEYMDFFREIGVEKTDGYVRMTKEEFAAIDLPTRF